MPSTSALRWMLGASLGLGAVDLLVIDLALAPEVVADTIVAPRFVAARTPLLTATATPIAAPEPAPEPPAPPAASVSTVKPSKAHVYFETRSARLDDTARTALAGLDVLTAKTIVLEGHADERGDDGYNRKLSRKRALAVHAYLVEAGVAHTRIEVRYVGEAGADDPDLWRDRRVDIQIIGGSR